ncbi:MAG: FeoA family protein [Candidatus Villigracilaceae bacterium]
MPDTQTRFPLADLETGREAVVVEFKAGRAVTSRLASLGLTPGVRVNMVQNYGRGPLIVAVRGTRVALGRGEAAKILVEGGNRV